MKYVAGITSLALLLAGCATTAVPATGAPNTNAVTINADATQRQIQDILNTHQSAPTTFVFARGKYLMTDPAGIRVPTGATLELGAAKFEWATSITSDGQTFLVENAPNVSFNGGTIIGQRDAWDRGANVAGIRVRGRSDNLLS